MHLIIRNISLVFISLLLCSGFCKAENTIDFITYTIKFNRDKHNLTINVKYGGYFGDREFIDLPYRWGNKYYYKQIKNVNVINSGSKFLIDPRRGNKLIIKLAQAADVLEIEYDVYPKKEKNFGIKKLILYDDLVHVPGHALFAVPHVIDPAKEVDISIVTPSLPKSWDIMSSFGRGDHIKTKTNIANLMNSVFIAGDVRDYTECIDGKSVNFSLYGDFDFSDKKMVDNASKIIESQRSYFDDYDFDHYLISVIEHPDEHSEKEFAGGTSLHNSFIAYLSESMDLMQYKLLLMHEHLHNWIGLQIRGSEGRLNFWWSEGFTEYHSRVLALRHGILNITEFLYEINDMLNEYYNSPVVNLSNHQLSEGLWNSYDNHRLPYLRGFAFALGLNCKIKKLNDDMSIDDILLDLYENSDYQVFSNGNFLKTLQKHGLYTDYIQQYFDKHIEQGQVISLDHCIGLLPLVKRFLTMSDNRTSFYYQFPLPIKGRQKEQVLDFFDVRE